MRALAVAKDVDADAPRARAAIALVRDAVPGTSSFLRALERNPRLAPAGGSFDDFLTWMDDIDEARHLNDEGLRDAYEAVCESLGCEPEAVRHLAEVVPFPTLPLGPFAQPCSPSAKTPRPEKSRAPLPPDEAAIGFYDWLIDHALIGEWSHEEMSEFYQRHCADCSLTPTPENVLRAVLKRLPGVNRVQDDHRVKGQGRKRPVVWKIELAPSVKRRVS